jgi:hypothetical protein
MSYLPISYRKYRRLVGQFFGLTDRVAENAALKPQNAMRV